jgi:hypothetical protein
MSVQSGVGLPEALERAASALPKEADSIRPANGDPAQLLDLLGTQRAATVLRWLLEETPADAADLVAAWADASEQGAAAVLAVSEEGLPKPARKLLRRAHHQLRSRGVPVPVAVPEATVATLPPVEEAVEEAVVTPLDPHGSRGAYLVASHPAGGLRMFEVVLNDARGIAECRVFNSSRSRVRKFLREFGGRGRLAPVSVPPDALRALVSRAAAVQPANRPLPRGFSEWRSVLCVTDGAPPPGELVREALGGSDAPGVLRRAADLVRQGEIGPWPPEAEALSAVADKPGEVAKGGAIIVSVAQRQDRVQQVLDDAVAELVAGEFAIQTAMRFEETAYVLWQREQEAEARACLAAAHAFRERAPENPVARSMLETVLASVLAEVEQAIQKDEPQGVTRREREGEQC